MLLLLLLLLLTHAVIHLDLLLPRVKPGGLFLAHNVVNKQTEMRDFLDAIKNDPRLFTTIVTPSGEGMSVSYKLK